MKIHKKISFILMLLLIFLFLPIAKSTSVDFYIEFSQIKNPNYNLLIRFVNLEENVQATVFNNINNVFSEFSSTDRSILNNVQIQLVNQNNKEEIRIFLNISKDDYGVVYVGNTKIDDIIKKIKNLESISDAEITIRMTPPKRGIFQLISVIFSSKYRPQHDWGVPKQINIFEVLAEGLKKIKTIYEEEFLSIVEPLKINFFNNKEFYSGKLYCNGFCYIGNLLDNNLNKNNIQISDAIISYVNNLDFIGVKLSNNNSYINSNLYTYKENRILRNISFEHDVYFIRHDVIGPILTGEMEIMDNNIGGIVVLNDDQFVVLFNETTIVGCLAEISERGEASALSIFDLMSFINIRVNRIYYRIGNTGIRCSINIRRHEGVNYEVTTNDLQTVREQFIRNLINLLARLEGGEISREEFYREAGISNILSISGKRVRVYNINNIDIIREGVEKITFWRPPQTVEITTQ